MRDVVKQNTTKISRNKLLNRRKFKLFNQIEEQLPPVKQSLALSIDTPVSSCEYLNNGFHEVNSISDCTEDSSNSIKSYQSSGDNHITEDQLRQKVYFLFSCIHTNHYEAFVDDLSDLLDIARAQGQIIKTSAVSKTTCNKPKMLLLSK